jgi:hypothetical protein
MNLPLKIFIYLTLSTAGFFCAATMLVLGLHFGLIDRLPADEHLGRFNVFYTGGGLLISVPAILVGLATFFTDGKKSIVFLSLPLAVPFLYCLIVLLYFSGV